MMGKVDGKEEKEEDEEEEKGMTIMPSLYKVYTAILAERLRKELER